MEVLRGSLLQRTVRHSSGCLKCARGEGHPLWVLNVGYPGGKTRQVSLRPDQVPQVRKAIEHYREFKQGSGGYQRTESVPVAPGPRGIQRTGARVVIATRRLQRNFADGFIAEAVEDLWEPWMRHADKALEDDALLLIIQQELAKRCKKSKTRGRKATPAEVVLRMLLLKHVRDWSYETLSREVRANLVYREFTRIGGEKVPDDRTMGNLARQLGPEVIEQLHRRVVEIAQEEQIATGRKMRVDTTVVETDVHYPTDSTLLGDGVRVLTRIMKKVTAVAGRLARRCATAAGPPN